MHCFGRTALALMLSLGACGAAHACPPPQHPPGWVEPSYEQVVREAYQQAHTVALVEVTRVKVTGKLNALGHHPAGMTEQGFVRPLKTYKGNVTNFPRSFQTTYSGTTCDTGFDFILRTRPIVFLTAEGRLIKSVSAYSSVYEATLAQLDELERGTQR